MRRSFLLLLLSSLVFGVLGCPNTAPTGPGGLSGWVQVTANAPWAGRHFLSGAVFNGQMWIVGGLSTDNSASVTSFYGDVWSSGNGSAWTEHLSNSGSDAVFGRRYGHRVLSMGTTMYLIGGYSGGYRNDVWATTNGSNWVNILPNSNTPVNQFSRRMDFGAQVFNGRLWVIGGWDGQGRNDVWSSADGITWTQDLADGPASVAHFERRWGHSTAVHNGTLWVVGGGNGNPSFPATIAYTDVWTSATGNTWTEVYPGYDLGAIYYHQTVSNPGDGRVWMTCGWRWNGLGPIARTGTSPTGATWSQSIDMPFRQRFYHLSLYHNGSVWIMGGMDNDGARTYLNDVWRNP